MSLLRSFSLVGDSNIRRNLNSTNTRGRPLQTGCEFLVCGRLTTLATTLGSVREDSDACVVACISNLLSGAPSASQPGSVSQRVEQVLTGFMTKVVAACRKRPSLNFFICPPMYRTQPLWYRDALPEILSKFSTIMGLKDQERPSNLWMMPSFSQQRLEADGVHLDPLSGAEYILYLFEMPEELVRRANLECDDRLSCVTEDHRLVVDRLSVLEQDHARLCKTFEANTASNAELADLAENIRNECFLMIQGLPKLPKLDAKEWQVRARAQVDKIFSEMGFEHKACYVQNSTGRGNDAKVLYKVCLESPEVSKTIRGKFGSYFSGGTDSRPPSLTGLSIRNCVTPATLGRIAIMQLLGKRYKDSHPGCRVQLISYEARPILKLIPAADADDRRVQSLNFIEAVTKLPSNFTEEETDSLVKRISPRLHDSLRSIFVVLSEDMVKRKKKSIKAKESSANVESSPQSSSSPSGSTGSRKGRKRGPSASGSGPSAKK